MNFDNEEVNNQEDIEHVCSDELSEVSETDNGFTRLVRQRDLSDSALPATVTKLETFELDELTPPGFVYVVGTAHFSLESQEDVRRIIQQVQPDLVMVELCAARVNVLSLDEDAILKEAASLTFDKIMHTIKQAGMFHGLMQILLLNMSAHITRQLGMAPGGEFRVALKEAKAIPGCQVHLGDRPVDITLKRAMASLSYWQRLRLAFYLVASRWQNISPEDVERCKQSDLLEEMLKDMAGEFPALSRIFLEERDKFMAATLRRLVDHARKRREELFRHQNSDSEPNSLHTSLIHEPVVVVGVVGLGHMRGIQRYWNETIDVLPLMEVPERSQWNSLIAKGFKGLFFGLCLYITYKTGRFIYLKVK